MADVASDIINNIEGYQQLLTTLSLGVCAGIFALVIQIIFHNTKEAKKVKLRFLWLIWIGVILQLISILFGILTKGALVASIPRIHSIEWKNLSAVVSLSDAGLQHISTFAVGQILCFATGTALIVVTMLLNMKIVRG